MRRPREPELPSLAALLPAFAAGRGGGGRATSSPTSTSTARPTGSAARRRSSSSATSRSELKAGGAGNAAQNLAALGVKVRAVGVVGDDALGTALLDELEAGGVDVAGIHARRRARQTEAKTRILAGGRSTRRQQMLRLDRAPREPLPAAVEQRLVRQLERRGTRRRARSSRATTARARSARPRSRRCGR